MPKQDCSLMYVFLLIIFVTHLIIGDALHLIINVLLFVAALLLTWYVMYFFIFEPVRDMMPDRRHKSKSRKDAEEKTVEEPKPGAPITTKVGF